MRGRYVCVCVCVLCVWACLWACVKEEAGRPSTSAFPPSFLSPPLSTHTPLPQKTPMARAIFAFTLLMALFGGSWAVSGSACARCPESTPSPLSPAAHGPRSWPRAPPPPSLAPAHTHIPPRPRPHLHLPSFSSHFTQPTPWRRAGRAGECAWAQWRILFCFPWLVQPQAWHACLPRPGPRPTRRAALQCRAPAGSGG